jgi:hypothetical protein
VLSLADGGGVDGVGVVGVGVDDVGGEVMEVLSTNEKRKLAGICDLCQFRPKRKLSQSLTDCFSMQGRLSRGPRSALLISPDEGDRKVGIRGN